MNLYPQDLRSRLHAAIILCRAHGIYGVPMSARDLAFVADQPATRLGKFGRQWTRGLGLSEQEAAAALGAASTSLSSAQWTTPILSGIPLAIVALWETIVPVPPNYALVAEALAAWGAITGLSMSLLPRYVLHRLYKQPLSVSEIDALLPTAKSDIDRAYLELMRAAVEQAVPPGAAAGLRDALRALGQAADSLPAHVPPLPDTEALRQQAAGVQERARLEQDSVAAESLKRQTDALERQAAASDRSAVVTHRAHVLREEVLAQIKALHAGWADYSFGGPADTALLAALSENARRVADEASAVAQARAELDAFVGRRGLSEEAAPQSVTLQTGRE